MTQQSGAIVDLAECRRDVARESRWREMIDEAISDAALNVCLDTDTAARYQEIFIEVWNGMADTINRGFGKCGKRPIRVRPQPCLAFKFKWVCESDEPLIHGLPGDFWATMANLYELAEHPFWQPVRQLHRAGIFEWMAEPMFARLIPPVVNEAPPRTTDRARARLTEWAYRIWRKKLRPNKGTKASKRTEMLAAALAEYHSEMDRRGARDALTNRGLLSTPFGEANLAGLNEVLREMAKRDPELRDYSPTLYIKPVPLQSPLGKISRPKEDDV